MSHPGKVGHGEERDDGGQRFGGAEIPAGRFTDDDGTTPAGVAAALAGWRRTGDLAAVVEALLWSRLLVGLIAVLDSADPAGMEKDSHMAAAMMIRGDGRKALLSFTSVAGLAAWDSQARPLPVSAVDAARAAIEDDADALLIDGECALTGVYLWALAEARVPRPPIEDAAVHEVIAATTARVLTAAGLAAEHTVAPDPAGDADVLVLLDPSVVKHPDVVNALAGELAAHPLLRSRLVRGLGLGVLAGPGD